MNEVNARREKSRDLVELLCCKLILNLEPRWLLENKSVVLATRAVLQHNSFSEDVFVSYIYCAPSSFFSWTPALALVLLRRMRLSSICRILLICDYFLCRV